MQARLLRTPVSALDGRSFSTAAAKDYGGYLTDSMLDLYSVRRLGSVASWLIPFASVHDQHASSKIHEDRRLNDWDISYIDGMARSMSQCCLGVVGTA